MGCDQRDKLSAWLDGELTDAVRAQFARHLDTCRGCRAALDDYRRMGDELRAERPALDPFAPQRALQRVLAEGQPSRSARAVRVPLPILAVLASGWLVVAGAAIRDRQAAPTPATTPRALAGPPPRVEPIDLARFDRGLRAEIHKVSRRRAGNGGER